MASEKKKFIQTGIFVALSIVLIYFVFKNINFKEIQTGLKDANWFWLFVSMGIALLSHLFRALRWDLAVEPMGYKIKNTRSFYSVIIGYLVNIATARGGEIARCAIINRTDKVPLNVLIGTVITERIVDLICLVIVIFTVFIFQAKLLGGFITENVIDPILTMGIGGLLVIAVLVFGFIFLIWLVSSNKGRTLLEKLPFGKKILNILQGFLEGFGSITKLKRPKLFLFYTLGIWICYWFMTYAVFFCFDFSSHFSPIVGLTALVFASLGMIAPAPGGIGALALVIAGLTGIYGLDPTQATLISSTSLAANIILITVVGILSLILLAVERRKYQLNDTPKED